MPTRAPTGIRFETVPPTPGTVLPRLDVAAFVGYASSGPLHLPVAVEDEVRFEDVFGPDPVLAWDAERGRPHRAYLGSSVRRFFRHGGRRCWVVRVAGKLKRKKEPKEIDAVTREFTLPALRIGGNERLEPLTAKARAPGSWADELQVQTVLVRDYVRAFQDVSVGDRWTPPLAGVEPHELVRFHARAGDRAFTCYAEAGGRFLWLEDGVGAAKPELIYAERLRVDLIVRDPRSGRVWTLAGLGLTPEHPRSILGLPDDAQLFGGVPGRWPPEIDVPRFPLAIPSGPGMVIPEESPAGAIAVANPTELDARERDGLISFDPLVFGDEALWESTARELPSAAQAKAYFEGRALHGMHALYFNPEVTLLALPDLLHSGWEDRAPPGEAEARLPAPEPAFADDGSLQWDAVEGADSYRLEQSTDPLFGEPASSTVLEGTRWEPPEDACTRRLYLRLRCESGGRESPWSRTLTALLPRPEFWLCAEEPRPAAPHTLRGETVDGNRLRLTWEAPDEPLEFVAEHAREPAFLGPQRIHDGPERKVVIDPPAPGVHYFRVRARGGPWSETLVKEIRPERRVQVVAASSEMVRARQEAQERAVRMGEARGDLFCVLAIPRDAEREDAIAHRDALGASSYAALYHPWPLGRDGIASPPDGAACGIIAARTIDRGAWIPPANVPLRDVHDLVPGLSAVDREALRLRQINLLRHEPEGFALMAADTLSDDADLRPVNVRRLLTLLRRLALREGNRLAFESHTHELRASVRRQFEAVLDRLYRAGAFVGSTPDEAYRVVADDSNNPPQSVDMGRLVVELRVAPAHPLRFLVVRLVQESGELRVEG